MPIRCFRTASGLRACPSSVRDRVPGSSGHHWRRFWAFVLNRKSRKQTPFGRTLTDSKDFGSFGKPRDGSFQQRHNMGNRSRVLKSYGHLCESLHTSVTEGWGPRSPGVPQSFWQRGVLLLTHRTTSLLITSTLFRTLCESRGDRLPHTPHQAVPVSIIAKTKISAISRTGIEPVTDGFHLYYYSPPLYQLSYREGMFSVEKYMFININAQALGLLNPVDVL